jgi:hypothetical protein
MCDSFQKEKIRLLEMQANYFRYLASVLSHTPSHSSPVSSKFASVTPRHTSYDSNLHDNLPVKQAKPFEQLLEDTLKSSPQAAISQSPSMQSEPKPKFLKRGEGHLCAISRTFPTSKLRTLRRWINSKSGKTEMSTIDLSAIRTIQKEIEGKNEALKREEKDLLKKKQAEIEEIQRLRQIKIKEIKKVPEKDEVYELRRRIEKMTEEGKLKEIRYKDEVKKMNVEIGKLKEKISGYERKEKQKRRQAELEKSSPEKDWNKNEGKIRQYVEKNKKYLNQRTVFCSNSFLFGDSTDEEHYHN